MSNHNAEKSELFQFGITSPSTCSYLPDEQEQLLVVVEEELLTDKNLELLQSNGFRRSGEQIYRPHCQHCQACQSIRLPVHQFAPSQSQKKLLRKNKTIRTAIATKVNPSYFSLYSRYINQVHADGSMFPPDKTQFHNFITAHSINQVFIELYLDDKLISVAVTDVFAQSCSAVYTFYDPDYRSRGIGIYSILNQIRYTQALGKEFLYLGYQIDACQKMNYKTRFHPHQKLVNNGWIIINK